MNQNFERKKINKQTNEESIYTDYYYNFNVTQWKGLCIHLFALI